MKTAHILLPDLFLPARLSTEVCEGSALPVVRAMLARAEVQPLPHDTLEDWLCGHFGVTGQGVAPVTLRADGGEPGDRYWLRADPVHLMLVREKVLLQSGFAVSAADAATLCEALDRHFAADGLRFHAPHPQRWYVEVAGTPDLLTRPLGEVLGRDVRACMPLGADALHWNRLLNEVQMLLYAHPLNDARTARGELAVNSLWLWGGGRAEALESPYSRVYSDSVLANAFATTAGIAAVNSGDTQVDGASLLVWEGLRRALQAGDLAAWRDSLQEFESRCLRPLWQALRVGKLDRITLDVLAMGGSRRFVSTPLSSWRIWRRSVPLAEYAVSAAVDE